MAHGKTLQLSPFLLIRRVGWSRLRSDCAEAKDDVASQQPDRL